MAEIVTIGEITLDDIVQLDGTVRKNVVGGGALYSAIGSMIWDESPGIHSVTGEESHSNIVDLISEFGIETAGINSVEGHGIELWLLHETKSAKQQVPKLSSKQYTDLDPGRGNIFEAYNNARSFHLAPQSVHGQKKALNEIHDNVHDPLVTLDLQADKFIKVDQYRKGFFLNRITALLPSREEVQLIWGKEDIPAWMRSMSKEGIPYIAVKMGEEGSMILESSNNEIFKVPIYPTDVEDTTGAGDSFCGGFLAGLHSGHDIIEAAVMGTVSASFIVEYSGALNTEIPEIGERNRRFNHVLDKVERVK